MKTILAVILCLCLFGCASIKQTVQLREELNQKKQEIQIKDKEISELKELLQKKDSEIKELQSKLELFGVFKK